MKPKFFMMVGLPGSGKSTVAEQIAEKENAEIISSDSIRGELFGDENDRSNNTLIFSTMYQCTISNLKNGKNVIYDATNISSKRRIAFLRSISDIDCEKIAIFVNTLYDECIRRNSERSRKVPDSIIKRMFFSIECPSIDEGFDDIIFVDNNKEQI